MSLYICMMAFWHLELIYTRRQIVLKKENTHAWQFVLHSLWSAQPFWRYDRLNQNVHLRVYPTMPLTLNKHVLTISPLSPIWKERAGSGGAALILPFVQITTWKGEHKQKKKRQIWVFLIHSARSNEISLVTAAHMHSIAWHGQIWQTLKQNTFDVCIHVEENARAHFLSVTKFTSLCPPGVQKHFPSN